MNAQAIACPGNPIVNYRDLIEGDRVHGSLYSSEKVFEEELQRIFYGGWVFIGHESEVPRPGDYVLRTIGREPLIFLRSNQGQIRVFSNRCTHRGNTLCTRERGNVKLLNCDYHGWSFSTDGNLVGVPFAGGFCKEKSSLGLKGPARVDSYGGFVFATFNHDSGELSAHLGGASELIDRTSMMSPTGQVRLSAGWVRQHVACNWKMLVENAVDGYHATSTHASFFKVFTSRYDETPAPERDRVAEARDWGGGHCDLNFSPRYKTPMEWFGTKVEQVSEYVKAMESGYGVELAARSMKDGPPHATIFPNLFLAEMNVVMFQPLSAHETIQWHTPLLLDGVEKSFNARIIRQSEAALGPSAFLLADDGVVAERQQLAMRGRADWMELSRGTNRQVAENGRIVSYHSDEVCNRGFWRHYRTVMEAAHAGK